MKVNIGPFLNYYGPFQIAETILFWLDKDKDIVYQFGKWLAYKNKSEEPSLLTKICEKIHENRKRRIKIKIHKYDSWNADETFSLIIVPVLKQLKQTKHGIPSSILHEVGQEKNVGMNSPSSVEAENLVFEEAERRWDEIMDKMIWAFEQNITDWEEQYWKERPEMDFEKMAKNEDGHMEVVWKTHGVHDTEGHKKHYAKMEEGFLLFGKHFKDLWD